MPTVVVPFRAGDAKRRLSPAPDDIREALAEAMLADVLAACEAVGPTMLATREDGQGQAVAAALREVDELPVLVVNADLPCAHARDLLALLGRLPEGGLALVAARDGTTNALALSSPDLFAPLYGPGSSQRFLAHAARLRVPATTVEIPNLVDDVDTLPDLEQLEGRVGPATAAALNELRLPR